MFKGNLKKLTLNNNFYRKVISTTDDMQLVLMSIPPNEEIGMEVHLETTQFIKVESGKGKAIIGQKIFYLKNGDGLVIPPKRKHNIINNGRSNLKLYTIYSPPEHPKDTKEKMKPTD